MVSIVCAGWDSVRTSTMLTVHSSAQSATCWSRFSAPAWQQRTTWRCSWHFSMKRCHVSASVALSPPLVAPAVTSSRNCNGARLQSVVPIVLPCRIPYPIIYPITPYIKDCKVTETPTDRSQSSLQLAAAGAGAHPALAHT